MTAKRPHTYPFVPRSTATLLPGQFWAIPVPSGSFGCGRVIEVGLYRGQPTRVIFLAAVLDWFGKSPPSAKDIAGSACLRQGMVHIKTIANSGGEILGCRPLELDEIEPWEFRGAEGYMNSWVYKGMKAVRPQQPADDHLPILSTWGFNLPTVVVTNHFKHRKETRTG